jgi:hypothetical protein
MKLQDLFEMSFPYAVRGYNKIGTHTGHTDAKKQVQEPKSAGSRGLKRTIQFINKTKSGYAHDTQKNHKNPEIAQS